MAKPSIKSIVDELIELEPTLTEHRSALEKNIKAIIQAKPDTKFTNAFKQKLLKDLQSVITSSSKPVSLSPYQTMQKFLYAIGGAAVASIGLYITVINPMVPMPMTASENDADGGYIPPAMYQQMMGNKEMQENSADTQAPMPAVGRGGGGGYDMASRMIAPGEPYPYTITQYSYDGEVTLPESDTVEVYRRAPLKGSTRADLLTGTFVDDMLNVGSLNSLSVTSVALSESGDEPLVVNVDFNDGNVGIFRQLDYSKRPESNCRDQACFERYRLKASDMISDERAIEIATAFARDLGVDLSQYGDPITQDDWRTQYETASADMKASFYFPEQVSVSYPYQIDGVSVYDEWGNANGLTISVDVRLRTAVNLWGLRTMQYVTEEMAAVDDQEKFKEFMEAGSNWGYMPPEATVQVGTLGDPRMVYMSQYNWNESDQTGYEVYVPALYFPVTDIPEDSYEYRKAVVVPLAKKLLEERLNTMPPEGMPMPVEPFMDPAVMPRDGVSEGAAG